MTILFLLMIGAWLGYREIGVSFLGIHIRDLISTRLFGFLLFIVAAVLCLLVLFISGIVGCSHSHCLPLPVVRQLHLNGILVLTLCRTAAWDYALRVI